MYLSIERIDKGNATIASFHANKTIKLPDWNKYVFDDCEITDLTLHYHESFDHLMPVRDKIHRLGFQVDIYSTKIVIWEIDFNKPDHKAIIVNRTNQTGEKPIKALWNAIIMFIDWYNENV